MAISDYLDISELQALIGGEQQLDAEMGKIEKSLSMTTNGIEGLPYQFPESVDRRLLTTDVGRKYTEKIFTRSPLLFLTPCEPKFMADSNDNDRQTVLSMLEDIAAGKEVSNANFAFLGGAGSRYYTTEFAYNNYFNYLNTMLTCVASYMKIYNESILINGVSNKVGAFNWEKELNESFATFFSASENLIFYLDSFDSVSESFSNDTTESSLASLVNGFSDQMNEIRFLFGGEGETKISSMINGASDSTSSIRDAIGQSLIGGMGGGIVGSLLGKGVDTVMEGGKIIFPEIWSNSDYSKSFNLEIKLRSPDNDPLSIFLNIIKPYCKLLALTIPREIEGNVNAYRSPFLVRAYCKGKFNIDMGIITGLSINKGGTGQWNDDGLPTQLDISVEIKDLYPKFAMNGVGNFGGDILSISKVVSNTAYMDFLANMSGLNVGQMEMGRRVKMAYNLLKASGSRFVGGLNTMYNLGVSRLFAYNYNIF